MMPRQSWTDERLDHFEKRVDERFDQFEDRVNQKFDQVEKRLDRMGTDIRELRQAMNQAHHTMVIGFMGLAGLIASGAIFF